MKFNLIKSKVVASRWNFAIWPAAVCLVWIAFVSGAAQLKSEKRITAVQLGSGAEGARVTIVSDAGLNDYEAFRRGERFYVRIPLAEFATARPGFHGDGFDDVQVQKVGDSVVVSFRLQPGASARVDQRGNRLEVIFTSAAKMQRPASTTSAGNQASAGRQRDAAGPAPSDSSAPSRERFVNGRQSPRTSSQRQPTPGPAETNTGATNAGTNSAAATPSPVSSVSPPPQQNYPAWTSSPVTTGTPVASASRSNASSSSQRGQTGSSWFAANQNALLVGGIIIGVLAVLIAVFLYRRSRGKTHAKRVKPELSQPKYSSESDREVFSTEAPLGEESSPKPVDTLAEEVPDWRQSPVEPAFSSAHAASANGGLKSTPSPSPVFVAKGDTSSEEREVFEI